MYQQMIRETLAKQGLVGMNPRHVEAWMRMEHPTMDSLSRSAFASEVKVASECVRQASSEQNEALAISFGLS